MGSLIRLAFRFILAMEKDLTVNSSINSQRKSKLRFVSVCSLIRRSSSCRIAHRLSLPSHDSRIKDADERTIARITGAIDKSTSAINENTNKGFHSMKGELAIAQSNSKIHHRETLNAFDRIEDGQETTQLSIKELTKSVRKQQLQQERCMRFLMEREMGKTGAGDVPDMVTTTTASLSLITSDEVYSPDMHVIRGNLFKGPDPEAIPSIPTTPDNSSAIADASYSEPKVNVLKDTNTVLKNKLKKEEQTTASMAVKLRQTEMQLKTWTSPRNKKPEDVQPLKVPQTEVQRQAEMKYIEQRRRGKMEQIKAQKLLDSERVPISRRTRSQRKAAENT